MLVADIHGHMVPEARDSEDYLTSAVFGHLRYLSPSLFWDRLFANALGMPSLQDKDAKKTLAEALIASGVDVAAFGQLKVLFWATHPLFGVPDLILCFTGAGMRSLVVLIEAKLWSEKSGKGEFDQIARYIQLLEQPDTLRPRLPQDFTWVLVYLTPHESLTELDESVAVCKNPAQARERIFRLQWQDVIIAARQALPSASGNAHLILSDIISFLSKRGLEYFFGFHRLKLPVLDLVSLKLFQQGLFRRAPLISQFHMSYAPWARGDLSFTRVPLSETFKVKKGNWIR